LLFRLPEEEQTGAVRFGHHPAVGQGVRMGRVWLGATHGADGARAPEAGAPAAAGRTLAPQPAQQHQQQDRSRPPVERRLRWLRRLVGNP
jgi:hypothetical protein